MDVDSIRNKLDLFKQQITCLNPEDSEAHLLQKLVKIRGLMDIMAKQIAEQANQLAPISSLPDELLLMIFKQYRNQQTDRDDKMRCAIVLSHVTTHWRR